MDYQKPRIETLKASDIIEMLGPVSCGSADPIANAGGGGGSPGGPDTPSGGGGGFMTLQ